MSEMKKINEAALENVVGGARRVVYNDHPGYAYANCRRTPGLNSEVYFTIPNGTEVETTGNVIHRDGYDWYEVNLAGAYDYGWIAGNLIGY